MKTFTDARKWSFFIGFFLLSLSSMAQLTNVIDTFNIQNGNDDAEQDINNGSMYLTSSDLELLQDGSSEQLVGIRFNGVNIPQGATINSAYIQFTVDEVNTSGTVDILIASEDIDDASSINSSAQNLSSRNYFFADTLVWTPGPFANINDADTNQQTIDISKLVQNSVNKVSWFSGNAILFGLVDPAVLNLPGYSGNTSKRVVQSRNKSSSRSAKLIVDYTPSNTYSTQRFPLVKNASWKYNDLGISLDSTNWMGLNYIDTSWNFGNGVLGYGNGNATTTLNFGPSSSNKFPTYYLRTNLFVQDTSIIDSLVFKLMRDDGAVVYVNGVEAFRMNMPNGTINYNTLASNTVGGTDETTYFVRKTANLFNQGMNVVAVELHQATLSSSDLSFDMEIDFQLPPLSPSSYPLAKGTDWHYLDNGSSLDLINWTDTTFNDDQWAQGPAPLGYGDPMNTVISYGPNPSNKHITYYFRRDMMVDTATVADSVLFGLRRDDGAVVYLNGTELFRSNMPAGAIDYQTNSASIVSGGDETTYFTYIFPKSVLNHGKNQLAVEIHNRDSSSSDLGFDLYIENAPVINPPALGCVNGANHISCFTSIAPTSQTNNLIIPSQSHTFQMLFKQGDAYTKGNGFVPGNHDFTGYVPVNGSSELGYLSVNHENTPGGVSILDMHYDTTTKLWIVDTTQAVDFFSNSIVTTTRNCSGGITPWGTVITAEESGTSADVNNDGYSDVGWLVEIDPRTKKIMDYDNDGNQDKLWAIGNVSHENAVVANDLVTLYTGEDGGSSAVFKFVADSATKLSEGKLYALQLNQPLSGGDPTGTTGRWIPIPNTTTSDRNSTSSLAISLGATNFNGVEDIEISPLNDDIYFTSKGYGRVYRFTDADTTFTNFETFVGGTSYVLNTSQGVFTEPWRGGNDNLTFDDAGNLWVLQDGGNNYIWMIPPTHSQALPKVELFASAPAGSEPTGLTFSPDYRFGFVSIQHPSSSNAPQVDASNNNVVFDKSATLVFAINSNLGGATTSINDKNKSSSEKLLIYPNPTSDKLTIEFESISDQVAEVEFYNLSGSKILDLKQDLTSASKQKMRVDLSSFIQSSQTVMVRVIVDGKSYTQLVQFVR